MTTDCAAAAEDPPPNRLLRKTVRLRTVDVRDASINSPARRWHDNNRSGRVWTVVMVSQLGPAIDVRATFRNERGLLFSC